MIKSALVYRPYILPELISEEKMLPYMLKKLYQVSISGGPRGGSGGSLDPPTRRLFLKKSYENEIIWSRS